MDVNKDGTIDSGEAGSVGISTQSFAHVDKNKDGELSKSEFVQAALQPVLEAAAAMKKPTEEESFPDLLSFELSKIWRFSKVRKIF